MKHFPSMRVSGILLLLANHLSSVDAHGIEVRQCITLDEKLRIFVEHWHGDLSSAFIAGTMSISVNHLAGAPTFNVQPTGFVNNAPPENLPGCNGSSQIVSICNTENLNDWWEKIENIQVNDTLPSSLKLFVLNFLLILSNKPGSGLTSQLRVIRLWVTLYSKAIVNIWRQDAQIFTR